MFTQTTRYRPLPFYVKQYTSLLIDTLGVVDYEGWFIIKGGSLKSWRSLDAMGGSILDLRLEKRLKNVIKLLIASTLRPPFNEQQS